LRFLHGDQMVICLNFTVKHSGFQFCTPCEVQPNVTGPPLSGGCAASQKFPVNGRAFWVTKDSVVAPLCPAHIPQQKESAALNDQGPQTGHSASTPFRRGPMDHIATINTSLMAGSVRKRYVGGSAREAGGDR
jgi:hypothetical protein